ncbi:putative DNA-binding protein [Bombilactobacillus thymidiniphilus]|uniref:UPF0122 protein MOO47_06785 n=1 Tax=Bombilactobacillus thymidiniphilus TaxID=2923363 RepID=A0ABY4PCJ7_9LACO|nr:putative DNA-binding protein [Bombilactobacillus thymidiniphilus]UQS83473.1 putative DNA-binding protein [Bombilactobacillus thymidiniphilus]
MNDSLSRKTKVNMLYDFYQPLLTNKQDLYMRLYYGDDYSLGEIAANYQVSRQAVYDNLKRTVNLLNDYENKLHLYRNFLKREQLLSKLQDLVAQSDDPELQHLTTELTELE